MEGTTNSELIRCFTMGKTVGGGGGAGTRLSRERESESRRKHTIFPFEVIFRG